MSEAMQVVRQPPTQVDRETEWKNRIALLKATNLRECTAAIEGDYFIVRGPERFEIYKEHKPYDHIQSAWRILGPKFSVAHRFRPGKRAEWKTAYVLTTLRQALRECSAQCMPVDPPEEGASCRKVMDFLSMARHYDRAHHGQSTF